MAKVTYDGPTRGPYSFVTVAGKRIERDQTVEINDPDVLKVLREGVTGHRFTIEGGEKAAAPAKKES